MKHAFLYISNEDVEIERLQCQDEGTDLSGCADEFDAVAALDLNDASNQRAAQALLDRTIGLPTRHDFAFHEPSDLEGIRAARPAFRRELPEFVGARGELLNRLHGAWAGRCCGCLLGKPVEGWRTPRLWGYLRDSGQYPLTDYISRAAPAETLKRYEVGDGCFREATRYMPEDDDTNYTTIGLAIMQQRGRDFAPVDVANFWLQNLPINHTFTAERVAYRNFVSLIAPPQSAAFRNPYREWIGAQIRADFWGYAAPGDPKQAVEWAWRDACISHRKNGIYGEMWVASMVASAFVLNNPDEVLTAGLGQIPERCRLSDAVRRVVQWHADGLGYDDAVSRIHSEWNENLFHHWCHTISNAMIVAVGLLWGDGDFAPSICRAVQAGFDTDCNGATVGSIIGAMHGFQQLPSRWTEQLNDTLFTGVAGFNQMGIREMAEQTAQVIEALGLA